MRKIIAVLLVFVLSFSCLSVPASAAQTSFPGEAGIVITAIEDGWTYRGSGSHTVTWAEGLAGYAAVNAAAEAIARKVPGLSKSKVYDLAKDTLASIVLSTTGGTLYLDYYTYTAPYQATQEMYIWKFVPWTNDSVVGPYTFINPNVISSVGDEVEEK
uniref:hypothetical protein n=1 Tax=Acetatifactor sp. TaxID=1872090 RepID=UPI004055DE1F